MANAVAKVNGVTIGDLAYVSGRTDANIQNLQGLEFAGYDPDGEQNWIRRQSGTSGNMLDGSTTNVYVHGNATYQPGTGGVASSSTWAWGGIGVDAISFSVASSYATTYQITHMGCGGVSTDLVGAINPQAMYFDILAVTTTGGASQYHLTKPAWNVFLRGYNSSNTGAYGAQAYPLTGTLPDLDVDTDYTAVWGHAGSQGFSVYRGTNFDSSREITTGGGTVTMSFAAVTNYNGSGYLGTNTGTHLTTGQQLIFGIKI